MGFSCLLVTGTMPFLGSACGKSPKKQHPKSLNKDSRRLVDRSFTVSKRPGTAKGGSFCLSQKYSLGAKWES